MANQIARNLAAQGEEAAAEATAQHIRDFWTRQMTESLIQGNTRQLNKIARMAIRRLIET